MISRLSQQVQDRDKIKIQEMTSRRIKIQEKMNSRFKRRNQKAISQDFRREVLKRIFQKPNIAQFCFTKEFSQNILSYQSFYSLVIDYQFPTIDYQWQSLISKAFN